MATPFLSLAAGPLGHIQHFLPPADRYRLRRSNSSLYRAIPIPNGRITLNGWVLAVRAARHRLRDPLVIPWFGAAATAVTLKSANEGGPVKHMVRLVRLVAGHTPQRERATEFHLKVFTWFPGQLEPILREAARCWPSLMRVFTHSGPGGGMVGRLAPLLPQLEYISGFHLSQRDAQTLAEHCPSFSGADLPSRSLPHPELSARRTLLELNANCAELGNSGEAEGEDWAALLAAFPTTLQKLEVNDANLTHLRHLSPACRGAQELKVTLDDKSHEALELVVSFPSLTRLLHAAPATVPDLWLLAGVSRLRVLHIDELPVEVVREALDAGVRLVGVEKLKAKLEGGSLFPALCPALRSLHVWAPNIATLVSCCPTGLKKLSFGWLHKSCESHVSIGPLVQRLQSLQTLSISGSNLDDVDEPYAALQQSLAKALGQEHRARPLRVDIQVSPLQTKLCLAPWVRFFNLGGVSVTDENLKALSSNSLSVSQLQRVFLDNSPITDAPLIDVLKHCSALDEIYLQGCNELTDRTLEGIANMAADGRTLLEARVRSKQVTIEALQKIRRCFPWLCPNGSLPEQQWLWK